jgi:hypothetical protein
MSRGYLLLDFIAAVPFLILTMVACGRKQPRREGLWRVLFTASVLSAAWGSPMALSGYGLRIMAAISLFAAADVVALASGRYARPVAIGLQCVGQVCVVQAFLIFGFAADVLGAVLFAMIGLTSIVKAWAWQHVPSYEKPALLLYWTSQCALVAAGIATATESSRPVLALGGALFVYMAGLCQVRDQYVAKSTLHALIRLPLIYVATWFFVGTLRL